MSNSNSKIRPEAPARAAKLLEPSSARKRATIYDLAKLAQVSAGTVSRVLNNRENVKAETRDRVLRAASELNLKPQVSVRYRQIAILSEPTFPDRVEGYAATLTGHLSFALSRRNMGILLPVDPFEQLEGLFIDGVVAVTFDRRLQTLLAKLEARTRVVYMDKFDVTPNQYTVRSDHFRSGYLAAQHFLARGKKNVGFLGGNNNPPFVERLNGFRKALTEAGAPINERLQVLVDREMNHLPALNRIVKGGADSIYIPGTSFQAMQCLHILHYVMGVKVPEEVSLIGGENEGISSSLIPPLTTIEEPIREMAEQTAAMLDALTSGEHVAQRHLTLPVRLIERDSVA